MDNQSRRKFLQKATLASAAFIYKGVFAATAGPTDIRVEDLSFDYEEFLYRAPYKFGGVPVDPPFSFQGARRVRHSIRPRVLRGHGSLLPDSREPSHGFVSAGGQGRSHRRGDGGHRYVRRFQALSRHKSPEVRRASRDVADESVSRRPAIAAAGARSTTRPAPRRPM